MLNQNKSITRTISDNSILDSRSNVLQRYVMLTFTYNLSKGALNNARGQTGQPGQQRQGDQFRPEGMGRPPGP